jgi:hypothetical protein
MCALREFCDLEPRGCGGGSGDGGGDGVCSVLKINIQYECGSKHLAHNSTLVDDAGAHGGALLRAACYHRRWVLRSLSLTQCALAAGGSSSREREKCDPSAARRRHITPIPNLPPGLFTAPPCVPDELEKYACQMDDGSLARF